MQEDHVGTTPTIRSEYATCPECGTVFRKREGHVDQVPFTEDGRSEYQELCPECYRLELQGERPLVGDVES